MDKVEFKQDITINNTDFTSLICNLNGTQRMGGVQATTNSVTIAGGRFRITPLDYFVVSYLGGTYVDIFYFILIEGVTTTVTITLPEGVIHNSDYDYVIDLRWSA